MLGFIAGISLLASVAGAEPPSTVPSEGSTIVVDDTQANKALTLAYSLMWGQDVALVRDIVSCESGYDEQAKNPNSSAKGLMQVIDGTWEDFDCGGNVLDAEDNLVCGMKILSESGKHHWEQCL